MINTKNVHLVKVAIDSTKNTKAML